MTTFNIANSLFTLFPQGRNEAGEIIPKGQYEVRLKNRENPQIFHRNYSYNHHRLVNRKYGMYWRCSSRDSQSCKVSISRKADGTLILRGQHKHPPKCSKFC